MLFLKDDHDSSAFQAVQCHQKVGWDGSISPPEVKAGKRLVTPSPGSEVTVFSPSIPYCFNIIQAQQGRTL